MPRIDFSYDIAKSAPDKAPLHNELIEYLSAIDRERSLVKAAQSLNISYRTLWSKIEYWEGVLGSTLIVRDQGKHSHPSDLGRKLLWAERTVLAKNALVIEDLRAQLESVFARACDPDAKLLTISGCYDPWLAQLPAAFATGSSTKLVFDLQFQTSRKGLENLAADRCDIACFNLPGNVPATSTFAQSFGPLIDVDAMDGIVLTVRTQGLATKAGNPLNLHSMIDVARQKARWANRAVGSGTGLLCLDLLAQAGLSPVDIVGFENIEPSHSAVATAIASDKADAGLCSEAAAQKLGLNFTPFVYENYYLVWKRSRFAGENQKLINDLVAFVRTDAWKATGQAFAGYRTDMCGSRIDPKKEWPWATGHCDVMG